MSDFHIKHTIAVNACGDDTTSSNISKSATVRSGRRQQSGSCGACSTSLAERARDCRMRRLFSDTTSRIFSNVVNILISLGATNGEVFVC